jgi:dihydroorotate dehydrogenase electron transfer subunit
MADSSSRIMSVSVPSRGQWTGLVFDNSHICDEHFRLAIRLDQFPRTRPGQFIQIACSDDRQEDVAGQELNWPEGSPPRLRGPELADASAMLRRPFSLAGRNDLPDGRVELHIIYRVVGIGTRWLSLLTPGQSLRIIGPLGNGFTPPPRQGLAILVGGGVGIPPMLYLAGTLGNRHAVAFCGATSRRLMPLTVEDSEGPVSGSFDPRPCVAEFSRHDVAVVLATDDGTIGFRGLVTQALERYLDARVSGDLRPRTVIYTCGPEAMMKRVTEIAAQRGIESQVSVERAMACGMGTCQSCVIRVKKPDPTVPPLAGSDWCYRLACTDGPVFKGSELVW